MKKILLSTIVLTAFSFSIILFQLSCKKSAVAASSAEATIQQQNKIIYEKNFPLPGTGAIYGEIWTANYDGSNQQKINITLPSGLFVSYTSFVKLSPDEKTIFFRVDNVAGDKNGTGFYSANIDGTNPKLIIANDGAIDDVEVAY